MEVSGKKAMTGLEATTAKLEATVKTEHGRGPEHGQRFGRWFTVAWRLIVWIATKRKTLGGHSGVSEAVFSRQRHGK